MEWTTASLSNNLKKLKIKPSYFLKNIRKILEDEDYLEENNFIKCPFCDSVHLLKKDIQIEDVDDFVETLNYSTSEKIDWINNLTSSFYDNPLRLRLSSIPIVYCDDCKKLLKIHSNLTLIKDNIDYEYMFELMNKDGTLDENEEPISCPCCGNKSFKHHKSYMDEQGEVEYDLVCASCNYFIYHFAYGLKYFD